MFIRTILILFMFITQLQGLVDNISKIYKPVIIRKGNSKVFAKNDEMVILKLKIFDNGEVDNSLEYDELTVQMGRQQMLPCIEYLISEMGVGDEVVASCNDELKVQLKIVKIWNENKNDI